MTGLLKLKLDSPKAVIYNLTFCGRPVANMSDADCACRLRLIDRALTGEVNPTEREWGLQVKVWKANGDTVTINWEHLR